ncbi:MAG TPA: DUF4142 domain-containing protein [Polyangia bacterium]|jgi:predicted outer membrane protein|nr:DUF4142 domain-containing protein [Polyangia bacterium]
MGKGKLGSWWAAGAAVCLLISAGVAAQTVAPDNPVPPPAPPPTAAAMAPPIAATVSSPYNERGGGDQRVLTELHRRNQQVIVDAELAQQRATSPAVRDYATALLNASAAADAKIVNYAREAGMNIDSIRLGAGAMANGSLTRVDLMNSSGARFDYDFATKMVNANQATLDQAQEGQALARAPGVAELLREIAPTLLEQQAQGMALVARIPTPAPKELQLPGQPAGVSRTHTGIDTRPGVAP